MHASLALSHTRQISPTTQVQCCSSCVEDVRASGGTLRCGSLSISACLVPTSLSAVLCSLHTDRPAPTSATLDRKESYSFVFFVCLLGFFPYLPNFPGPRLLPDSRQHKLAFCSLSFTFSDLVVTNQKIWKVFLKKPVDKRSSASLCRRYSTAFCVITDRGK